MVRPGPAPAGRRALGQWFTATPVARLALAALAPFDTAARVLDPTCGDGGFLATARAAGLRSLTGIEIDPAAAAHARGALPEATIVEHDLLAPGLTARLGTFDLVIGNPPWVGAARVDPAIKRARAALLATDWPELPRTLVDDVARYADVAATCLLRALRFVSPGGHLALVTSTALLDADGAAAMWQLVRQVADVRALITAPAERWFADAAVNAMIVVLRRRHAGTAATAPPRLLRLTTPTHVAANAVGLDGIAAHCDEQPADATTQWTAALRAPAAWFTWRAAASPALVPLGELVEIRRGITTGANDVFYLKRRDAVRLRLESRYLADVVRSPFNGSPAPIAIAPGDSPLVALALPATAKLVSVPRIAAWLREHAHAASRSSVARRDPWWSLPVHPARLFLAKAYGPRFIQRYATAPMLADQRLYALTPRPGVDLDSLAAVLNALPTALALESLGRASLGYGVIEWTVQDALELPVLDVRRADAATRARLAGALAVLGTRPIDHVKLERHRADRAALDTAAFALAPDTATLAGSMWTSLLASVALRDRYLLPAVGEEAE